MTDDTKRSRTTPLPSLLDDDDVFGAATKVGQASDEILALVRKAEEDSAVAAYAAAPYEDEGDEDLRDTNPGYVPHLIASSALDSSGYVPTSRARLRSDSGVIVTGTLEALPSKDDPDSRFEVTSKRQPVLSYAHVPHREGVSPVLMIALFFILALVVLVLVVH